MRPPELKAIFARTIFHYLPCMPELPEVEVLVRHLAPLLRGRTISDVQVLRSKVLTPTSPREFKRLLKDATFGEISRRGKYLLFELHAAKTGECLTLVGHLGMTGRMYLLPAAAALPKHAAVILSLGRENFIYEDTRYFGRLTFDGTAVERLGPEPLGGEFTTERFAAALKHSAQPIKVKLLDQSVVAGIGNIYASEALFRAGISPRVAAWRLKPEQIARLRQAIRKVLVDAIEGGSTVPLNYSGAGERDGLFYFGRDPADESLYEERLRVYDRQGKACVNCGGAIKRLVQAARSTFYCPACQRG
jgi:formamidopyrimidine-DNA glycosylase